MNEGILGWLLDQAPVIVIMGIVIWWLQKRLIKSEEDKTDLSNAVIKLTTLWEAKANELGNESDEEKQFRKETLALLNEIRIKLSNKQ